MPDESGWLARCEDCPTTIGEAYGETVWVEERFTGENARLRANMWAILHQCEHIETSIHKVSIRAFARWTVTVDEVSEEVEQDHGPMSIAIGVVAHVSRQDQIARLSGEVKPDAIHVDDGSLGVGANHLITLLDLQKMKADWLIVLEDDALTVPDFRVHALLALAHAPSPLVSFYLGTGHPSQHQGRAAKAAASGVPWIMHPHMRHGLAYAVSAFQIGHMIQTITPLVRKQWAPDDAISQWALMNTWPVAYTNPSLADHNNAVPSVITKRTFRGRPTHARTQPRHAHNFGIREYWDDTTIML